MFLCVKGGLHVDGVSGFSQGKLDPYLPSVLHWEGQGLALA